MTVKRAFIGVDPGTTTAAAIVDYDGNIISIKSQRSWGSDGVINYILKHCKPSIIATDVDHLHSLASKISTSFGVKGFHPEDNLEIEFKQKITKNHNFQDAHQMDALSAALTAYNSVKSKILNLKSKDASEEEIHLVLQGFGFQRAKKILEEKSIKPEKPKLIRQKILENKSVSEKRLANLEQKVKDLNILLEEEKKKSSKIHEKYLKLKRDAHLEVKRDSTITLKEKSIVDLKKKIWQLERRLGSIKKIKALLHQVVNGDALIIEKFPKVVEGICIIQGRLSENTDLGDVSIVFSNSKKTRQQLEKKGIITKQMTELESIEGVYFLKTSFLEKIRGDRKISLEKIINEYRETG